MMSGQPKMNIVDDDDMSSLGTVNVPMVAPKIEAQMQSAVQSQYVLPFGLLPWPQL